MRPAKLLSILLCAVIPAFSQGIEQYLLSTPATREQLVSGARNRLIDLIKENKIDSVALVIKFCDSICSPDTNWLLPPERFFIKVISEDLNFVKNPANYETYLDLKAKNGEARSLYWYYAALVRDFPPHYKDFGQDRGPNFLFRFLKGNFHKKVADLRRSKPDLGYVWDFCAILFSDSLNTYDEFSAVSNSYHEKYPKSPFTDVIRCNFLFDIKNGPFGLFLGFGFGGFFYDSQTKSLFENRGNLAFSGDMVFHRIPVKITIGMFTFATQRAIASEDSISFGAGSILEHTNLSFSTGYIFPISGRHLLTPYFGYSINHLVQTEYEQKRMGVQTEFPDFFGGHAGVCFDYILKRYPVGFRFDAGYANIDYSKLQPDLGKHNAYFNTTVNLLMFRKVMSYEFRENP